MDLDPFSENVNSSETVMSVVPRRKSRTLARLKKLKAEKILDQAEGNCTSPRSNDFEEKPSNNEGVYTHSSELVREPFAEISESGKCTLDSNLNTDKDREQEVPSAESENNSSQPVLAASDKISSELNDKLSFNSNHNDFCGGSAISDGVNKVDSIRENVSHDVESVTSELPGKSFHESEISRSESIDVNDNNLHEGEDVCHGSHNKEFMTSVGGHVTQVSEVSHQRNHSGAIISDASKTEECEILEDVKDEEESDDDLIVIGNSSSDVRPPSSQIAPEERILANQMKAESAKDISEDEAIGSASSDCGCQHLDQLDSVLKYSDISANNVTYQNQEQFERTSTAADSLPPDLPGTSGYSGSKRGNDYPCNDLEGRTTSGALSEPLLGSTESLTDTNRSFLSTGALPPITTQTARRNKKRSYLMGGMRNKGSLLGKEELERNLPDRKIRVFVSTWNMHEEKNLPDNLEDLLLPEESIILQDIYVVGTQESTPDAGEWAIRLQETLGTTHILLHKASLGVLHLLIFIRRDLYWFCSPVEEDSVATRPGSMIKTKGAVAVSFTFFGTSFLFIVSHFTSGDDNLSQRVQDYSKIIRSLDLPIKVPPTRKYNVDKDDITSRFDAVFWCGDFNFRLMETKAKIENWTKQLKEGNEVDYNILLQHDQLRKTMTKSEGTKTEYKVQDSIFKGFQEGEINFLPTYKFDPGEDVYDTSSKARIPSYTDRVLFKPRRTDETTVLHYNSCQTIKCSDHRPVYGIYEVKIRPGRDDIYPGSPSFAKDVFAEANRRRAAGGSKQKNKSQKSAICSVM